MSASTNDFSQPDKDHVNYISTNLSVQMVSTQNDDQSSDGVSQWIQILDQISNIVPSPI